MTENLIIHCDKCDSTNVLHEQETSKPVDVHKKMSDVASGASSFNTCHSVYYYRNFKMICKDCGHIVTYQV